MMHEATARVARAPSPRLNECMFCNANDRRPLDILWMNAAPSRCARQNDPATIKVGSFRERACARRDGSSAFLFARQGYGWKKGWTKQQWKSALGKQSIGNFNRSPATNLS